MSGTKFRLLANYTGNKKAMSRKKLSNEKLFEAGDQKGVRGPFGRHLTDGGAVCKVGSDV